MSGTTGPRRGGIWYGHIRWMYRGRRPNALARLMNRLSARQYAAGLAPGHWVSLEVPGRRTGRTVSVPLVVADHDGGRYLVAMLGERTNWVANVRAAGGRAVLRHGRREVVRLTEVPVADRPPILRRHLTLAPGARPHVPVDRRAPLADFARIAADFPVFRITAEPPAG
ncbi:nitroreductase/quinone reductase family protein [Micromonospora sp. R77]|uniref:nitroreductase/quinone reductase family protein n=1 Tax=Micromonospora sp. R77 TaxID=2925836 RepID=UPI001F61F0FE|nr:nitroreductase/quinone reductase family protein [Micromonospora sp. R77]MCI4065784.1 nitroreductase/quinone reductase family protein [Micromonospora sp. R77]